MKVRLMMAAAILAAVCTPAAAQSVSQLPTKPAPESKPVEKKPTDEPSAVKRLVEKGTAVNLAVPAGLTAAVGDSGQAAAVPRLGFQAWKPDDFFAGAFFSFDTAPTLNGDLRKAGQFVRDPPNTGSSFLLTGNRMFTRYRCGRFVKVRPVRMTQEKDQTLDQMEQAAMRRRAETDPCNFQSGDRQDAIIIGLSTRLGASTTTLQHKPSTTDDKEETHEASILHFSLSGLFTSRTFRTEDGGEYQFGLEVGGTARLIAGDAASHPEFLAKTDVLGHNSKSFIGVDTTFFARLNGFQPFVRLTHIPRRDGSHVPGLTGFQASLGINVFSALFQTTKETKKPEDEKKPDDGKKEGGDR